MPPPPPPPPQHSGRKKKKIKKKKKKNTPYLLKLETLKDLIALDTDAVRVTYIRCASLVNGSSPTANGPPK